MSKLLVLRGWRSILALVCFGAMLPFAVADEEAKAKIRKLEAQLAQKNGEFDWKLHNELRHFYGAVDREKEFHHMNVMLKNSLMDDYVLKILSSWELENDKTKALTNLRQVANAKRQFPHVVAACWIKVAQLESAGPNVDRVRQSLQNVVELKSEGLDSYRELAKELLSALDSMPD